VVDVDDGEQAVRVHDDFLPVQRSGNTAYLHRGFRDFYERYAHLEQDRRGEGSAAKRTVPDYRQPDGYEGGWGRQRKDRFPPPRIVENYLVELLWSSI